MVQTYETRYNNITGSPTVVVNSGDTVVYTPNTGKKIRLKWIGMSSPVTNLTDTVATIKWSSGEVIYTWDFAASGGAFAHGTLRDGPKNGTLICNLSQAATVRVNIDVEEVL